MSRSTPWWVLAAAVSFFSYFGLLVYCDLWRPEDAGLVADYSTHQMVLTRIVPGSPADRAGLRPRDIIASADGRQIHTVRDWTVVDAQMVFDRPIALRIARDGQPLTTAIVRRQASWSYLRTGP